MVNEPPSPNSDAPVRQKSIRFRARSFVAFCLVPEAPLGEWLGSLDRWTKNSPGFFVGRPVVLDLKILQPSVADLRDLVVLLADRGIRIYAIEADNHDSLAPDLPPLLVGAKAAVVDKRQSRPEAQTKPAAPVKAEEPVAANSLIIRTPIRSGQSIFQPQGDVIVLGAVGSGSEIIAGGSVHVYGALRGRVIAGAMGNAEARIFCRRNEAELLAVDGCYRTADEMEPSSRGRPIQAFLENGIIQVAALN